MASPSCATRTPCARGLESFVPGSTVVVLGIIGDRVVWLVFVYFVPASQSSFLLSCNECPDLCCVCVCFSSFPIAMIGDLRLRKWIGEADKHDFQGMLTRDIIQSACGIPDF